MSCMAREYTWPSTREGQCCIATGVGASRQPAYLLHTVGQGQQLLIAHTVQCGDDQLSKLGALLLLGVLPAGHAFPPVLPLSIVLPD